MSNPYDDDMNDNAADTAADDGFASEYDNFSDEESDRKVGTEPIPSFGYYIADEKGAAPSFEFDDKSRPVARHRFEVVAGPEGTVGLTFFVDQPLYARSQKWTDKKDGSGKPIFDPLTADERAEAVRQFQNTMNRIARVFSLGAKAPKDKSMTACGAYCAQFEKSTTARVVIGIKKTTRNGFSKNTVTEFWNSLAALDDKPSPTYKGKAKTAQDEAMEKIAERNKGGAKGGNARAPRATSAASSQSLD